MGQPADDDTPDSAPRIDANAADSAARAAEGTAEAQPTAPLPDSGVGDAPAASPSAADDPSTTAYPHPGSTGSTTGVSAEATEATATSADAPRTETGSPQGTATQAGPTPGAEPPPWSAPPPPPSFGSAFTHRYGLVRPFHGRYFAGVCAAIGQATNTDPVLWRVLLAVLSFAGGIGILIYLAAWLIIPSEGDTASPIESMLGRGDSSMSPALVIILSLLVAVLFAFIVTDKFRAMVLGAAIVIGGALLLNRSSTGRAQAMAPPPTGHWPSGSGPAQAGATAAAQATPPYGGYARGRWIATPSGYSREEVPLSPPPPQQQHHAHEAPSFGYPGATAGFPPQGYAPGWRPAGGAPPPPPYRPPFAPHGPYAQQPPPPPPVAPPRPAPPPRERSRLGTVTLSMIFIILGVVAMFDLTTPISVSASAYFAAALVTIGAGLIIGAWFGRARWLIALGLATAIALGITTLAERYSGYAQAADVSWRPTSYEEISDRYVLRVGDALLDLTAVDFTGRDAKISARVEFGDLHVIVPPEVDVEARVFVDVGDAQVFGTSWSGIGLPARTITDLGDDGRGGGTLRLNLHVSVGSVEVYR